MDGLTAGRMTHYVMSDGAHLAAIVTGIQDADRGVVDLNIQLDSLHKLVDSQDIQSRYAVLYDENRAINTWHWIEAA